MSTRQAFSTRAGAVSTAKIPFTPLAEASQFAAASRGAGSMFSVSASSTHLITDRGVIHVLNGNAGAELRTNGARLLDARWKADLAEPRASSGGVSGV
jgi:hypothetical protein